MAIKPLVLVYQELRAPSSSIVNPTLTGVVVGPHYHVRTYAEHKAELAAGLYDVTAGSVVAAMPAAVPGMKLKSAGFKIYLDKVRLRITGTTTATVDADGLLTKAGVDFNALGVKKGDTVKLTNTTGPTTAYTTVQSVDSATTLQLSRAAVVAAGTITYEISRVVSGVELPSSEYVLDTDAGSVELPAAGAITLDLASRNILEYADLDPDDADADKAQIYCEYTALNVKYASVPARLEKNTDITSLLGITDERNPLGLGATVMYANAQATINAIGIASEDTAGWLGAIDAVNRPGFYAQAVLTDDVTLLAAFKANNEANAAPEKAKYGIVFGSHRLPTTITPATGTGSILVDIATSQNIVFEDLTADFKSTAMPVLPGDILTVDSIAHTVDKVVNANRLKVTVATAFAALASGKAYTVTRALTKTQQAESLAATSRAMGSKRAVLTYSDLCVIGGKELPGYYLSCATAGMVVGLPSQAGITNKGIAGIEKVLRTNWDYFSDDQLDTIAAGGTLIYVQDDANSLPYVRMQLTTDPALLETGELSVVKNNDYLSLFFKNLLKPFLGTWNVTPELLDTLRSTLSQGILFQVTNRVAKIGAPLISADIKTLEVSAISPDRVEIYLETKQPKPLNTIGLHIIL